VLGQRKLLSRLGPGLMHAFIFWGFCVLLPTIVIAMIGVVDRTATRHGLGHQGWYALLVDIFATLVLCGRRGRPSTSGHVCGRSASRGSHLREAGT